MPRTLRQIFVPTLFILFLSFSSGLLTHGQQEPQKKPVARQVKAIVTLRWKGEPGVTRYRLQLATDKEFTDIVFDRKVIGLEYVVTELPSGHYYSHVAPALDETGEFSPSTAVEVTPVAANNTNKIAKAKPSPTVKPTPKATPALTPAPTPAPTPFVLVASPDTGWRTATGSVTQPLAAPLRSASSMDFIAVNGDGMVYALDAINGVAMWTARFRPNAKRGEATGNGGALPFTPLLINSSNGQANVVVAFDGGVRSLDGATGRELWRANLEGRAASGAVAYFDTTPALIIADDSSSKLFILDGNTGKMVAQEQLPGKVIGAPVIWTSKDKRGLLFSLDDNTLEMRGANGERIHAVKLDTKITTQPFYVEGPRGALVLVGSESGLISLGDDLKPLGRVAMEGDAPRGTLAAADLDGDGAPEVVFVTRLGRVVAVSTSDGKIRWHASGAVDAASAAFADLNGDGSLDVIVAAGPAFAVGLSGRDGAIIWRADESGKPQVTGGSADAVRWLLAASVGSNNTAMVVGSDAARTGLRAVELPKNSVKSASR
ncbi:MAG: PQQ-binding-like beta-propeller repeat protein [Pyrinomonadaceae bacterium]